MIEQCGMQIEVSTIVTTPPQWRHPPPHPPPPALPSPLSSLCFGIFPPPSRGGGGDFLGWFFHGRRSKTVHRLILCRVIFIRTCNVVSNTCKKRDWNPNVGWHGRFAIMTLTVKQFDKNLQISIVPDKTSLDVIVSCYFRGTLFQFRDISWWNALLVKAIFCFLLKNISESEKCLFEGISLSRRIVLGETWVKIQRNTWQH